MNQLIMVAAPRARCRQGARNARNSARAMHMHTRQLVLATPRYLADPLHMPTRALYYCSTLTHTHIHTHTCALPHARRELERAAPLYSESILGGFLDQFDGLCPFEANITTPDEVGPLQLLLMHVFFS